MIGEFLFTSRTSQLSRTLPNASEIKVGGLPDDEALEVFLAIANRKDLENEVYCDQNVAKLLVKMLENFPLAIAQAASFLRLYNSISGTDYLKSLQNTAERSTLLNFSQTHDNYNQTVMTTWEMSYQSLLREPQTAKATILLTLLGFLDPAGVCEDYLHSAFESRNGYLREDLLKDFDVLKSDLNFKIKVDTLVALSLVSKSPNWSRSYLSLHPLVHEWTRVRLDFDPKGRETHNKFAAISSALAMHHISIKEEDSNMSWRDVYLPTNFMTRICQIPPQSDSDVVETVIVLVATIIYRKWMVFPSSYEVLGIDRDFVEHDASSTHVSSTECATVTDFEMGLDHFWAPGSMYEERWFPSWAESTETWAIVESLNIGSVEADFRPYTDCLICGLRFLRAISKELDENLRYEAVVQPTEENHLIDDPIIYLFKDGVSPMPTYQILRRQSQRLPGLHTSAMPVHSWCHHSIAQCGLFTLVCTDLLNSV